jgi:hypothetical protein
LQFLAERQVPTTVVRYDGGHEFTDEFRRAVADFLASRRP